MLCHECLMSGKSEEAVGLCKFCLVGLCKEHLTALYNNPATVPQYGCRHNPTGRPSRPLQVGTKSHKQMVHEEFNVEEKGMRQTEPALSAQTPR